MHQAKMIYHSKAKTSICMHKVSGELAVFGTGPEYNVQYINMHQPDVNSKHCEHTV
jgi:hypothetical protein